MAHCAEVSNGIVQRVIVVDNAIGDDNVEDWCVNFLGGTWKRTSYNANGTGFRKNYAGIGFTYDAARNAFIAPYPGPGWVLDEQTCQWVKE